MKVAIFFTGGKDSTLTILRAKEMGHDVRYLFTVRPKNPNSYMFHSVTLEITKTQAELMGIEHYFFNVSGEKESEVEELITQLKCFATEIDAICIGAIKSLYQYKNFEKIAKELNIKLLSPLWNSNCVEIWKELIRRGFKVIITKTSAEGLTKDLIGKVIDEYFLKILIDRSKKFGFDLCFEGGEAETLVLYCPLFSREIKIKKFEILSDINSHFMKIKDFFV